MKTVTHLSKEQLEAGLDQILQSPKDEGILELIVVRPAEGERQVLEVGELNEVEGLIGDNWNVRPSTSTPDNSPHPEKQLNIMNSRSVALIAQDKDRWQLAGDQLYIDLDLSDENLPAGSRIKIGTAIIEITPPPHNGCKKFVERFGLDAMKFVNSEIGKKHHLRGVCAKVVQSGTIKTGDIVYRL